MAISGIGPDGQPVSVGADLTIAPSGSGAWALLDETARRNMDAELQAQGYAPTATVDYTSSTAPDYVPVALFGSDAVPSQAANGKPAVPAGSTATAYGS